MGHSIPSSIHPMMKFLSFVVLVLLSFTLSSLAQECSGPCNPAFPTCQLSTCEGDVCVTSAKLPVPEGCCTRTTDCLLLNDDDDDCTYECDFETNQCVISECNEPLASGRCNSDRDCDDNNSCTSEKCIDNICVTSPNIATYSPECCNSAKDCAAPSDCHSVICSASSFRCIYSEIANCVTGDVDPYQYYEPIEGDGESDSSSEEEEEPGVSDIIGAIIGFVVLAALVLAFIVVLVLMIVQRIIRKLTSER